MDNKKEIIRKTEGQFRKSNLPLMEVPQREQIKQRKKNFWRNNTRKLFRTKKIKFLSEKNEIRKKQWKKMHKAQHCKISK